MVFVRTLTDVHQDDLPIAGGKGSNLAALIRAGLPVPGGFVVTTEGYRAFVRENGLGGQLGRILDATRKDDPASLESAAERIRDCFRSGRMAPALALEIGQAYRALGAEARAVAVRSSATAEDLPDLSFAGQQDTYLNIRGEPALLDATVRCWASLWTARAIGYRDRNGIAQDTVALAVVVQEMVQSEASGVLFTANPLTGKRSETVIDATFGLGEALVSGQVEPDHYVVDGACGKILSKSLGAKALCIRGQAEGGTACLREERSTQQALPDDQILALARLGRLSAERFGAPQDLEWAWAEGRMRIVQSRPITSLYPLPAGLPEEPPEILLSFGIWQGMLDPYTPLGRDIFSILISGMGRFFGLKIRPEEQRVLLSAGERLFIKITGLARNKLGRAVLSGFLSSMDHVSESIVKGLLADPRFAVGKRMGLPAMLRLARGLLPFAKNIAFNMAAPERGRKRFMGLFAATNARLAEKCAAAPGLDDLVDVIRDSSASMVRGILPKLIAVIASGQGITLKVLASLAADLERGPELVMELTRGLPHNVTTEMDLALWGTAQAIRSVSEAAAGLGAMDVADAVAAYRAGALPSAAQAAIAGFLKRYGMRGVGEVDLGRARWREDPTFVLQAVKSYLEIDEAHSPAAAFHTGAARAEQAERELAAALGALPGGGAKRRKWRFMARRLRELGGLREFPKFALINWMGIYREALLAFGQGYAEQGALASPDDLFFLHMAELKALGSGESRDWRALVDGRRADYAREARRTRIPRVMLSDGTSYYDAVTSGAEEDANALRGSPVSPGVAEGLARVVLDPHDARLLPGEILVCPATDPGWTPLFLTAGALVMEVGGMMTHGSVVAREYGIPAVVGVACATERLKTGQRLRVDGASGTVSVLD
jgi:pyruvate,water dikinase